MSEQIQAPVAAKEVPKDLLDQVGAIRAIATCHNLIDKGNFNHKQLQAVNMSLEFLRSLYENAKNEALSHPDADLVPELVDLKNAGKDE